MATITEYTNKDGSKSWRVRLSYQQDGKRHRESRSFPAARYRRKDVTAWAARREIELEDRGQQPDLSSVTLSSLTAAYIEDYEKHAQWSKSKGNDLRHLMKYPIAAVQVSKLTANDYIGHIKQRLRSVQPATARNDLIWWRIVLKTAIARGLPVTLDAIDSASMICRAHRMTGDSQRRTRRPTLDELDQILAMLDSRDGRQALPMVDIVLFQIFSARRIAETCSLRWEDYDPERSTMMVRNAKDPRRKGNHIITTLTAEARAIIERQPRDGERIFPYKSKSAGSNFERTVRLLGIDDLRMHDLRHEATSWCFETGMNIPQVSKVTGHRSWQNLQRYAHMEGAEPFDRYRGWRWNPIRRAPALQVVG